MPVSDTLSSTKPQPIPFGPRTVAEMTISYRNPEAPALIDDDATLTYRQLDEAVNAACKSLTDLGLSAGERIAASSFGDFDLVIAFLATQRLGLVWVGISPALAGPEVAYQLEDAGVSLLLADAGTAARLRPFVPESVDVKVLDDDDPQGWRSSILLNAGASPPSFEVDPFAPAVIAYTSGTTARPKGAVHSQHSTMAFPAAGHHGDRGGHWIPTLRRGVTVPLTVFNGMIFGPLLALYNGGAYVCIDRRDAVGVAEAIARHEIETVNTVGTTMYDLLTKPEIDPRWLSSLRYASAGGAPITPELKALFRERIGGELVEDYGLTESPCSLAGTTSEGAPTPTGCVGRPFPHIEVKALDPGGHPLADGQTGEIAGRAVQNGTWAGVYTAMLGYWHQPDATAATLKDGWLHTGDIGYVDAEGCVYLVGRGKDTILRGGANIYPAEIEMVVIEDERVGSVVVLGMPDARLGETPVAYLELRAGLSADQIASLRGDLVQRCAEQLAKYKIPQLWFVVDQIPRNAMLKADKRRLRELTSSTPLEP